MKPPRPDGEQTPTPPERIRPELNVEKWSIWQPANARGGPPRELVLERDVELSSRARATAKLTVSPTTKGNLTTKDQRVYYALVKYWEDRGRSPDRTRLSLQRLARLLGMDWGRNVRESLAASLLRLRGTLFVWEQAFEDKATGRVFSRLDTFNLLADLKIVRTKDEGQVGKEAGHFRFHEAIVNNLLANHTKPVLFDVVLSFKSDIAQLIYTHLDLVLSDKACFERRTRELFEDLGLEGKAYRNLSDRKRALERALPELQDKPLTTGRIAAVGLEPTKDGEDLKLVVRKGKAAAKAIEPPSDVAPLPPPASGPPGEAEQLVRHFHRVFHGADECYPTARAVEQAATLVARHGAEKARHVVDVARREARKTGHKVATFGGIMQYEAAAVADFERAKQDRERRQQARGEARAGRHAQAGREAEERAEEAEFDEQWGRWGEGEREAFRAEALARAEGYGLGFQAARYRRQSDKAGRSALLHLRTILVTHYRQPRPPAGS